MSAESLRFAAETMRLGARYKDISSKPFIEAVADLLECEAASWDAANREEFPTLHYNTARAGLLLTVARAYLGGSE